MFDDFSPDRLINEAFTLLFFLILSHLSTPGILGMKDVFVPPTPTPVITPIVRNGQIKRVVDGDTIRVIVDGQEKTVRLIGIDTPETVDPRKEVQCFGKEASDKAKEILGNKTVTLESDPSQGDKDKYDRLLRYVFLEDQTNFNKLMIAQGYAYEYTYALPYKYQKEFKEAQTDAQASKKGLWTPGVCGKN